MYTHSRAAQAATSLWEASCLCAVPYGQQSQTAQCRAAQAAKPAWLNSYQLDVAHIQPVSASQWFEATWQALHRCAYIDIHLLRAV